MTARGRPEVPIQAGSLASQLLNLRIDTLSTLGPSPIMANNADTGPPNTQDSLSLGQLKKLVGEGAKQKVSDVP